MFAYLLGSIAITLILLTGAIRLDQFLLRWRAKRLQSDVRSLEFRKSTYADARRIEDRWWDNTREGVCRPHWCDLGIYLQNAGSRHLGFLANHPAVFAFYHTLGGRSAAVYSYIGVRDGLLLEKGIRLSVEASSIRPDGTRVEYELIGSIDTASPKWVSARHPEYQIGGPSGCMNCKAGWVRFTSFADPKDVLRLTDINFACITSWRACKQQADILPKAWKELQGETAKSSLIAHDSCPQSVIRVLSRESHQVVLAKVFSLERSADGAAVTLSRITPGVPQYADTWQEQTLTIPIADGIHIGSQMLVFDDAMCRAVPATEENLNAARLGAGEGWVSPVRGLGLPFGDFAPPKIDVH